MLSYFHEGVKRMGKFEVLLDEHLKRLGLTQTQFAERIGVTQSVLSEFKRGRRDVINKPLLDKVMTELKLTKIDDIIRYIPDEK